MNTAANLYINYQSLLNDSKIIFFYHLETVEDFHKHLRILVAQVLLKDNRICFP